MKFTEYKGLDLVAAGNEVLDRWKKNHAFEKSLEYVGLNFNFEEQ